MLCPGSGSGIARTMSWTGSQNTAPLPLPGVLSVALSVPAQASGVWRISRRRRAPRRSSWASSRVRARWGAR